MDIRFGKPELDFSGDRFAPYGGGHVTVTATAWCGSEQFFNRQCLPSYEVGGDAWPHIINEMHTALVCMILKRYPPTDFTIKKRR